MEEFCTQLDCISSLMEDARQRPDEECVAGICTAIVEVANSPCFLSTSRKLALEKYLNQNYHEFIREMMNSPSVYTCRELVKSLYVTFKKVIERSTLESLEEKVHTCDFVDSFLKWFARDIVSFETLYKTIIGTATSYFVGMNGKKSVGFLKEFDIHFIVADVLSKSNSVETTCMAAKLVSLIIDRYWQHLRALVPFVQARIPHIIVDKVKESKFFSVPSSCNALQFFSDQFNAYFNRIILNLTANHEAAAALYEEGYLEKLMAALCDQELCLRYQPSIIHAIGNLTVGNTRASRILLDSKFYEKLLHILNVEISPGNPYHINACCRVLSSLLSGYDVKRKYLECGCVDILQRVLGVQDAKVELWIPLKIVSRLGSVALAERQFCLTSGMLEAVAAVCKSSSCSSKCKSYAALIFLQGCKLDSGTRKLRELGIAEVYLNNPISSLEAPSLVKWGHEVIEKLDLYTMSYNGSCGKVCSHPSDWPVPVVAPSLVCSSEIHTSIPPRFEEAIFKPETPMAPALSESDVKQLRQMGLSHEKPVFRVGRLYGSTYNYCKNCNHRGASEELVIRPHGMSVQQYQQLVDNGWNRRGGVKLYRLRHNHNIECCCWETRVVVKDFDLGKHKSFRKVLRRMPTERLTMETCHTHFSREAFDLYNEYHVKKHDKPIKSEFSYCEHVVNTPTTYQVIDGVEYGTFHQMYRLDGKLVAVEVVDVILRGMVSVYMWYDISKEIAKYSFGVYSVLKDIEVVKSMNERNPDTDHYYYLQGWNINNPKLSYKSNYGPEEFLCPCSAAGWVAGPASVEESKKAALELVLEDSSDMDSSIPVEVSAFPVDKRGYEDASGKELDISKTVVCLNYSKFLHLEDALEHCVVSDAQKETIKSRLAELYVSLPQSLSQQLVIDFMVCESSLL